MNDSPTIQETLEDQFRITMKVISEIKGDTDVLLRKTEGIIDVLSDDAEGDPAPRTRRSQARPNEERSAEPGLQEIDYRAARFSPRRGLEVEEVEVLPMERGALIKEITRACVKEVMETVNPVLSALDKFIKANGIGQGPQGEPDDDAFAEKLIEEMKVSLGRRQKIALARKRMSAP